MKISKVVVIVNRTKGHAKQTGAALKTVLDRERVQQQWVEDLRPEISRVPAAGKEEKKLIQKNASGDASCAVLAAELLGCSFFNLSRQASASTALPCER